LIIASHVGPFLRCVLLPCHAVPLASTGRR
jgi:hypothetical protein